VCKVSSMTACWTGHESVGGLDQLLVQYHTDAVINYLSSTEPTNSVPFKGD